MLRDGLTKGTLLAVIAALIAFAVACGSGSDDDDDNQATTGGSGEVQELTVATSASELKFFPSEVTVKVGEPVVIVLDNSEGTVLHDWSIEEMHVSNVHTEGGAEHMMDGESMDNSEGMAMDDEEEMHMDDEDEDMHEMGMEGFALRRRSQHGASRLHTRGARRVHVLLHRGGAPAGRYGRQADRQLVREGNTWRRRRTGCSPSQIGSSTCLRFGCLSGWCSASNGFGRAGRRCGTPAGHRSRQAPRLRNT